jgi:hypothetical protein
VISSNIYVYVAKKGSRKFSFEWHFPVVRENDQRHGHPVLNFKWISLAGLKLEAIHT